MNIQPHWWATQKPKVVKCSPDNGLLFWYIWMLTKLHLKQVQNRHLGTGIHVIIRHSVRIGFYLSGVFFFTPKISCFNFWYLLVKIVAPAQFLIPTTGSMFDVRIFWEKNKIWLYRSYSTIHVHCPDIYIRLNEFIILWLLLLR